MISFLRGFFLFVLVAMLCVTTWAGHQQALWAIPPQITQHPWFIATLFDTYFAFLTFYCWLAYKETSWWARGFWLIAILLLGNIAMATYVLIQLFRLRPESGLEQLLLRRKKTDS